MYRDGLGVEKNLEIAYALGWITYWGALGVRGDADSQWHEHQ